MSIINLRYVNIGKHLVLINFFNFLKNGKRELLKVKNCMKLKMLPYVKNVNNVNNLIFVLIYVN